ncbi:MAG TPA: hypothetical protein VJ646_19515 [Candidatus Binatia bacterium]|nr:hypothetical protein [Candidatus Binatia bacterium]
MITDEKNREQIACEATYLANELVRQLTAPSLILEDSEKDAEEGNFNFLRAGAIRNFCILGIIVNLYRVIELRENFLIDILFGKDELRDMGFPSIEELIGGSGKMKYLEILRHQFAGHATAKRASVKKPGKIIPAKLLGTALRETGIQNLREFATRLRDDLASQLERFVGQMRGKFLAVDKFVKDDYPLDLEKGRLGQ